MKATGSYRILLTVLFLSAFSVSFSQDKVFTTVKDTFDIRSESFLLPQRLPKGKYTSALYILYIVPPKDWTLDAVVAPMFQYSGRYTLNKGFNLQASLATLFISNRLSAGPFWNYDLDRWHFAVGYQVAFNYGVLNQFGFHTTLTGWEQQPSLTAGYSFGKTAVILRGDLFYTNQINFSEGGNVISNNDAFLNGYSLNASFEQRITKNRVMSLGFKLSYLRYHVLAWPAFPVNSYRYFIPEFQIGLNF